MDKIYFTINGEKYSLSGSEVSPETTLNEFIRDRLHLFGTKAMCHEGGCGACVVAVAHKHAGADEKKVFSVNSCLVHILSCHGWEITTIEGVGGRRGGYHPLQSRLAAFSGTQCGYCTPGWIMNMYSVYERSGHKINTEEVERSFGGNICRCTGYRPILDAFKTFATDVEQRLLDRVQDMEEIPACVGACPRRRNSSGAESWCLVEAHEGREHRDVTDDVIAAQTTCLRLDGDKNRWYKAYSVKDVFQILSREGSEDYTLVAGNTGKGVFWSRPERVQIDISSVVDLRACLRDANLELGAGITLTEMMEQLKKWQNKDEFKYLDELHKHLELVAHVPVRNIGTIGGNLAMKHRHPEFPSDIFLLLDTLQATITIVDSTLQKKDLSPDNFLKEDLKGKLITKVTLPPLASDVLLRTYKIMPRAQNAHAIVNAGFYFKLDSTSKVVSSTLAFGNVSRTMQRASRAAAALQQKQLFSDEVLQQALKALAEDLQPEDFPPEPSPACRKILALGLFYKAVLSLCGEVNPRYVSGKAFLMPGVSRGTQTYDTDKKEWPVNQPMPKLEAKAQCAGAARFSCDAPTVAQGVHVAFVLSERCTGDIDKIDGSQALKEPGVVAFYTAADIPGSNTFTPLSVPWQSYEEEILASSSVKYYGQPLALVVGNTRRAALNAVQKVKVTYKGKENKPVLTIKDALSAPDKDRRVSEAVRIERKDKGSSTVHVLKGSFNMPSQYHFTLETQSCTCEPTGDGDAHGLRLRCATQWMDHAQAAVAHMLNLTCNRVLVEVPRVGGAYGGKASRASLVACACALAAYKLDRPATMVLPLTDNMAAIGKRNEFEAEYEVGVDASGVIQYLDVTYYSDSGCGNNEGQADNVPHPMTNLYASDRFQLVGYDVITDKPTNTWCRAPASTEGIAFIEHIMERISFATKLDPFAVRIANLAPQHEDMRDFITTFKNNIDYEQRIADIEKFNTENAWRKKALKISLMSYPIMYDGPFNVVISVYHGDGTVAISHAGIEMGQGINTKVACACAYDLKIPLEKIVVRGSDSFTSANAIATSGSIGSESVVYAARKACEILNERLAPYWDDKKKWEEVVVDAYKAGVDLQARYMTHPASQPDDSPLRPYDVYGACAVEVELDVLTGQHKVSRADLYEDTGLSLSPDIDVGQVEGAFVMGLGLWTCEQLVFDPSSGRLLTDRTWTYKPPGANDIPRDLRVRFNWNPNKPKGVLGSKATGEPALTLSVAVTHALHHAIREARKEFQYDDEWLHIRSPYTVETILKAISPKIEYYKLK